jgi:hypothetical protein
MGATESGVYTFARDAGIELLQGSALPWLTNRGHLNPVLHESVSEGALNMLRTIHQRLGGDELALANKRSGASPRPDFLLPSAGLMSRWTRFSTSRATGC